MSKPLKLFQRLSSAWKSLHPQAERFAANQLRRDNPRDTFNPKLVLKAEEPEENEEEALAPEAEPEASPAEADATETSPEQTTPDPKLTLVPESNTETPANAVDPEPAQANSEPAEYVGAIEQHLAEQGVEFVDEPFEEAEEPVVPMDLVAEALLANSWSRINCAKITTHPGGFVLDCEGYVKLRRFLDNVFRDEMELDCIDGEVLHEMDNAVRAVRYALDAEYNKIDEKLEQLAELKEQADAAYVPPGRRSDGPLFDAAAREERERQAEARRQAELKKLEAEQAADAAETGDGAPVESENTEAPTEEAPAAQEATNDATEAVDDSETPQVHPIAAINKALKDAGVTKSRSNGRRKKADEQPDAIDAVGQTLTEAAEVA